MNEDSQQTLMNLAKSLMQRTPSPRSARDAVSPRSEGAAVALEEERDELRVRVGALEAEREQMAERLVAVEHEASTRANAADEEVAAVRAALEQSYADMEEKLGRKNSALREELDQAMEREAELRATLQGDYESRSGKEGAKWETALRRLEEEKDILAGKLEDYSKIKSQGERMRDKVEEMDAASKALKDRLAVVSSFRLSIPSVILSSSHLVYFSFFIPLPLPL